MLSCFFLVFQCVIAFDGGASRPLRLYHGNGLALRASVIDRIFCAARNAISYDQNGIRSRHHLLVAL